MSTFPHFATNAIHVGQDAENWSNNELVPPICLATTFKQEHPAQPKKYDYSRAGNASREVLETCLASLEDAKYCHVFASGLSATMAVCGLMSTGDHIICCDDVYGGSQRYLRRVAVKNGIRTTLVDLTNLPELEKHLTPDTKLIWIETPTNPLLKVIDIRAVCDIVKRVQPTAMVVVDNTFMTPYFQRPLDLGADIVVHSITKYLNGHVDVVMGCAMTRNEEVHQHLNFFQLAVGANPSPFDCYLVNRGLKTLHLRMKAHYENALRVAQYLEAHPMVERVMYPALPSHPQHEIHKKQTKGMSGMMSFYLKGNLDETIQFLKNLKVFILAESLGGYESLAEHPALMTHASVPAEERAVLGIGDNLIRFSVGVEDIEDLIADLDQAFKRLGLNRHG